MRPFAHMVVSALAGFTLMGCASENRSESHTEIGEAQRAVSARTGESELKTPGSPECAELCARSESLRCQRAIVGCSEQCAKMLTVEECFSEVKTFMACARDTTAQDWECDEDGDAALKTGFCEGEQQGVFECLARVAALSH